MREAFSNSTHFPKLKQPIALVLSGGTAMPAGFQERFENRYAHLTSPSSFRKSAWLPIHCMRPPKERSRPRPCEV